MKTRAVAKGLSGREAQVRLGELIDAVAKEPIEIAAEEGRTAYLVSTHDFDAMVASVEELTDQLWLVRADLALEGGFVGPDEMQEILGKLEEVSHADE